MGIGSAFDTFQRILGLTSGGLAGVFLLGIFFRRAHSRGAWAGAIASGLVLLLVQLYTKVHVYLYSLIGITVCVGVGVLVSLNTRPPPAAIESADARAEPVIPPAIR